MGAGASRNFSFWSADEAEQNESALECQARASAFLIKYLFYGVPVRRVKKSADPKSPVWIETHPDVLSDALNKKPEEVQFGEQLLRTLPSGVAIDHRGDVKVFFTLYTTKEIIYEFKLQDIINVEQAHQFHTIGRFSNYVEPRPYSNSFSTLHEVNLYHKAPMPLPPVLVTSSHNSLTLSTLSSIPQPAGIVQQVEIQYSIVSAGTTTVPVGSMHSISSLAKRAHKRKFIAEYVVAQQARLEAAERQDKERIEALIRRYFSDKEEEDKRAEEERQRLLRSREEAANGSRSRSKSKDEDDSSQSRTRPGPPSPPPALSPLHTSSRSRNYSFSSNADDHKQREEELDASHTGPNTLLGRGRGIEDEEGEEEVLGEGAPGFSLSLPSPSGSSGSGGGTPFLWHSLVTLSYAQPNFSSFTFDHLQPGEGFVFRLRYRNHLSFSPYSLPTLLISTRSAPPSVPEPPVLGPVTSTSVMLFWQPPSRDNGSSIRGYVVRGRSVGAEWVSLYEGPGVSFLASDLFPDFAYSFQVAAVNAVGRSDFSESLSTQTPARARLERDLLDGRALGCDLSNPHSAQFLAAMRCAMAWRELWDPAGQQIFYFNRITAIRQLERPPCLGPDPSTQEGGEDGGGPMDAAMKQRRREIEFRKKRFNLMRALHKDKPRPAGGSPNKGATLLLELDRTSMLGDAYSRLAPPATPPRAPDLAKRLRFSFVGEEGIDSGGSGKEAFLLLSRAIARYLGGSFRCLLRTLDDCPPSGDVAASAALSGSSSAAQNKGKGKAAKPEPSSSKGSSKKKKADPADDAAALEKAELEEEEQELRRAETKDQGETADGAGGVFFHEGREGDVVARNNAAARRSRQQQPSAADAAVTDVDGISDRSRALLDAQAGEALAFFFGRLLGKAVLDRQLVDVRLSGVLLSHMQAGGRDSGTGTEAEAEGKGDVEAALCVLKQLDPSLHRSLLWMRDNDITGVIDCCFSVAVEDDKTGGQSELALCVDGLTRAVTEENKLEYIALLAQWKSRFSVEPLLGPFLSGFHELVPSATLQASGITPWELGQLLSGRESVDVDDLRAYVVYQSISLSEEEVAAGAVPFGDLHEQVVWFWQCCRELSQDQLRSLLRFFTGSSRIPIDGFDPPLTITQGVDMAADALPRAHACFNQLVLPSYSRFSLMQERVVFAAENSITFDLS